MSTKYAFFIALAGILVLAAGCAPKRVALTADDRGSQVEAAIGQQIVVSLEGNPSTGYTWEAQDLDEGLLEQVGEAEFMSSAPGLVGSGGTVTLTFKALLPGTTTLTLVYHRPWEPEVEPLDTFTITLGIQ